MTIYLDCAATTPMEPKVRDVVLHYMEEEFGNAGSRTHEFGQRAKAAVQKARLQVAEVVEAEPDEITFTSGATESLNIAILGLLKYAEETGKKHIISTQIEHKAVLEPLEHLANHGFEIELLPVSSGCLVDPDDVRKALRPDTLLVSVMHVNNETGVIQYIPEICDVLSDHPAYFLVDGAQGYGKEIEDLKNSRIDLISVSGHKIYGPKGIGALIARKRKYERPPLLPLMYGGGQERGLRPGTLAVPLIAGLGEAAGLAAEHATARRSSCAAEKALALQACKRVEYVQNGNPDRTLVNVLNISISGADAEAIMVAMKDVAAISNGSACTSSSYEPSHVLIAMKLPLGRVDGAIRVSWSHLTKSIDWDAIFGRVLSLT